MNASLLGDGGVYQQENKNLAYWQVHYMLESEAYAWWLAWQLGPWTTGVHVRPNNVELKTFQHPAFVALRERWYDHEGVKHVPADIDISDPLTLAVWVCDDGCTSTSSSEQAMRLTLATDAFAVDELDMLAGQLHELFGGHFGITNNRIQVGGAPARRLFEHIDPVFPREMAYKAIWRNPGAKFYGAESYPRTAAGPPPNCDDCRRRGWRAT